MRNGKDVVKLFQKSIGTNADGIIGKQTLKAASKYYNLSPSQAAHFFGQLYVESAGFEVFEENLNYSAVRLCEVFPRIFTSLNVAKLYANNPELTANRIYADRMGNGDPKSGDGWKYRGRGAIQLTGKNNYDSFALFLGQGSLDPDLVSNEYAFLSAFWFFGDVGIWSIANHGISRTYVEKVTRKVNGGTLALEERIQHTERYYSLLTL